MRTPLVVASALVSHRKLPDQRSPRRYAKGVPGARMRAGCGPARTQEIARAPVEEFDARTADEAAETQT